METNDIINALRGFVEQRPGLNPANYGDRKSYRQESREVTRDLHDAREILGVASWTVTADDILAAARGGRLSINERPDGIAVEYHTGQYFPTEYRKAVCRVLAQALWNHNRERYSDSAKPGESAGDAIRRRFRQMFGHRITRRYFD
jgi:hypothetical protein